MKIFHTNFLFSKNRMNWGSLRVHQEDGTCTGEYISFVILQKEQKIWKGILLSVVLTLVL